MGDNNELANLQNAALTSSLLSKNGIDTSLPFSRDIFLMNTMINGAMHVKTIYKQAKALQKGDKLTLQSKILKNIISIFVSSDWPYLLLMLHINTHQIPLFGKTTDIRRLARSTCVTDDESACLINSDPSNF